MKLRAIHENSIASDTADPKYWDKDPNFIDTIHLLNKAGFKTISSCMGHAPGTQYEHVDEWMEPYLTFVGDNTRIATKLLADGGFVDHSTHNGDTYYVGLHLDVDWVDVLKYIRSRLS
jgi:hypothetical protein